METLGPMHILMQRIDYSIQDCTSLLWVRRILHCTCCTGSNMVIVCEIGVLLDDNRAVRSWRLWWQTTSAIAWFDLIHCQAIGHGVDFRCGIVARWCHNQNWISCLFGWTWCCCCCWEWIDFCLGFWLYARRCFLLWMKNIGLNLGGFFVVGKSTGFLEIGCMTYHSQWEMMVLI